MENIKEKETHKCIGNMQEHKIKDCPLLKKFKQVV